MSEQASRQVREMAKQIFLRAVRETSIPKAFAQNVEVGRGVLRVCDDLYQLDGYKRIFAIAMGKAAHTMARELKERMGRHLEGILVSPEQAEGGHLPGFRYFSGGHPLPNGESMKAADAALKSLRASGDKAAAEQALVIYLISGGASSMLEKPLTDAEDNEITLEDLIATYRVLVHSGAPITEVNAIRKHLSAVKGGRLAQAAGAAQQVSIMVSDVPEDALEALASGPTMPDPSTCDDCYEIANRYGMIERFPAPVRELFQRHALEETPKADAPAFRRARWWNILSNATAQRSAASAAAESGWAVESESSCDDWDHAAAADHLLARLRELRAGVARVCIVSGGEVTVKVGDRAGVGGRNQQFALYCAQRIAGENICVLSAGTDGIDGNSPAAGAVADGTTVQRASGKSMDVQSALQGFDAYPLLHALGDTIEIGPTGNNVRDLRMLMAW